MTTPTFDIIVPIWNNPTEARACLVSILDCAPDARMIIINNGCDRTTELMLEEFCDHLAERALYMTMERNIGFVPAVNRALARSDADWALLVRPTGTLSSSCFKQVLSTTGDQQVGIITPHCPSDYPLPTHLTKSGCPVVETCDIGFSLLALSKAMRNSIGLFDEGLDSSYWCLRDYRHRANAHGFRTYLLPGEVSDAQPATIFGSRERRKKQEESAITTFQQRWGLQQHLAIYLPKCTEEAHLYTTLDLLLAAARHGHRLELFLHRSQYLAALKKGAACLHCGVTLHRLSMLSPLRSLARKMETICKLNPQIKPVTGLDGTTFPGYDKALPATVLTKLANP